VRWQLATALALVCTLAVPAIPAQSDALVVDAFETATIEVDLIEDAGDSIVFRLDEGGLEDGPLQSAFVRLHKTGESVDLALQRSASIWSVGLSVSTPDLVAGAWTVDFYGVSSGGGSLVGSRALDVTADDRFPPRLFLASSSATPILLGPGDSVSLLVSDPLLRRVTYQFGGLPEPLPLAFPYALRGDILPDGITEVTFRATDRAGHSSSLAVDVERDSFVPRLSLVLPEHAYLGGELRVEAVVQEDGPYTLRLNASGVEDELTVSGRSATTVNRTSTFRLLPTEGDSLTIVVEAIDRVGNRALAAHDIRLEPPIVDAKAVSLAAETPAPFFVQDPVRLVAVVQQVDGVATLPLTVTLAAAGQSASFVPSVAPGSSGSVTWTADLPGGMHEVVATVAAPATANETDPANQEARLAIEVFLGGIQVNGKHFVIRASDRGLPTAALEFGSTRTYPLKIVDQGSGVAYQFTAGGNQTYVWDPLDPVQDLREDEEESESSSSTADSKGAAAPGLVMALLVVALAALAQRRRIR
jgi:MYXO-CTERM domain-containing protein